MGDILYDIDIQQMPAACMWQHRKLFFSFSLFSIPFIISFRLITILFYFTCTTSYYCKETYLVGDLSERDDGGTEIRGKCAKVASACVIATGKYQLSGISEREVMRGQRSREV